MRCGLSLYDLGGRLRWASLLAFLRNLGDGSALMRSLGGRSEAAILADIMDNLTTLRSEYASAHGASFSAKRYPRPRADEPKKATLDEDEWNEWMRGLANG